jgi:S1-C subfamily serine protease
MSAVYGEPGYAGPGQSGTGPSETGQGGYGTSGYGPGQGGYGQGGYGSYGGGSGGYGGYGSGPGGYGPGGYGPGGYGPGGSGPDQPDGGRQRRRRFVLAGASTGLAAVLAVVGLGAVNAAGSSTLTTAQIASKVDPGLVDVVSTLGYQNGEAAGTGMVLTSTGEVLTNNHVIDGATSVKVRDVGNGRTYTAKVVGYDKTHDVAVLQMVNASGLTTVSLSSSGVQLGDKVVGLGNALGKGGTPSVAPGKVTATGRTITASDEDAGNAEQLHGLIQTNAGIQPGDSGGPLVNTHGDIVGMDTAASSNISTTAFGTQSDKPATQAFAIPISHATAIADQIEAGKASSTVHIGASAFLGVEVSPSSAGSVGGEGSPYGGEGSPYGGYFGDGNGGDGSSTVSGASVAGAVSGSAAAQAGLTQGDVITSVDGHTITSATGVSSALAQHHPGDSISISWTDQSGQSHTATVQLGAGPAD